MKTLILVVTVSFATASAAANVVAPVSSCTQIVQNLNASASAITQNSKSYWQHRAKFVSLNFAQLRPTVPNSLTVAGQEKSAGDALRAAMPNSLASFVGLVTAAQSQKCLAPTQLSAIAEPTIKLAKRVNLDQFPQDEPPIESSVKVGEPRMPTN